MSEVGGKYRDPTENDAAYRRSVLRLANANDPRLSFEEAAVLREQTIVAVLTALAKLTEEETSEEALLLVGILEEDLDWRALSPQHYGAGSQIGLIPNVYEGMVLDSVLSTHLANNNVDRPVSLGQGAIMPPPDFSLNILRVLGIPYQPKLGLASDTEHSE